MAYEYHYTGYGYPTRKEIETEAKKRGFKYSFWATENINFNALYNGDTIIVYDSYEDMPLPVAQDAMKYGKEIE